MQELIAMLTERPYVVAFLATFLLIAWSERGPARTLFWLASGTFLGWLLEFSSVRTGFPFGDYTYNEAQFPDELWLGGVPFFASLSFAFLTYFGYSAACTFLSPLEGRGVALRRRLDRRLAGSLLVLLLAAAVTTWVDTVIDPVAHLGEYWFLGDLYAYTGDGVHFDVPLSNYAGWLFAGLLIVFVNQRFDALLRARGSLPVGRFRLPFEPLWAIGTIFGNFAFMLGVSAYLMTSDGVPSTVPAAQVLASGLALSAAFAVLAALMLRRGLTQAGRPSEQPAPSPEPALPAGPLRT